MPALDGMRVLDMTQYEAGTSCTQLLAWLGADVIKIEPPGRGDPGRGVAGEGTVSQYFLNYNSNKRSLVIDLSKPAGLELLLKMVPLADVFVENYGPGVVEKLGVDYPALSQINSGIIYGRIKGFGVSGPYSQYRAYDWVAQASAGAFSVTGERDGPPMTPAPTIGDSGSGAQMALSITAAYVQRQQTGEGQLIELSMQEAVTLFMRTAGLRTWGTEGAKRNGNRRGPPTDVYPCKPGGANDHIFFMVVTDKKWDEICTAIEEPEMLHDERFKDWRARLDNVEDLYEIIATWTRTRSKYDAMHHLASFGVPCSATLDTMELFTDPHLKERGLIKTLEHPEAGDVQVMGMPARLSGSEVPLTPAPLHGEHTDEVLRSLLQIDDAELDKLRRDGIIS